MAILQDFLQNCEIVEIKVEDIDGCLQQKGCCLWQLSQWP
jgi:hypothetical protein